VDDSLRAVRPLLLKRRTFKWTAYRSREAPIVAGALALDVGRFTARLLASAPITFRDTGEGVGLSASVTRRFHQTPSSAYVRRVPLVSSLAAAWWHRSQAAAFRRAFDELGPPVIAGEAVPISLPQTNDLRAYGLGDAFTEEMFQCCRTSKFKVLGYQDVYARVLSHIRGRNVRLLEVGIGVADPHAPSGMSRNHRAGASLTGWAHYFAGSEIHGADVDRRALVDTDLYRTHYVDQRDPTTLKGLGRELGAPLDVVIDDGLHTPEANANTVSAFLPLLRPDGVLVVEDILPEFDFLWHDIGLRLRPGYRMRFYPSTALRQERGPGGQAGIAVFARANSAPTSAATGGRSGRVV
jgi:hypothetical protein